MQSDHLITSASAKGKKNWSGEYKELFYFGTLETLLQEHKKKARHTFIPSKRLSGCVRIGTGNLKPATWIGLRGQQNNRVIQACTGA